MSLTPAQPCRLGHSPFTLPGQTTTTIEIKKNMATKLVDLCVSDIFGRETCHKPFNFVSMVTWTAVPDLASFTICLF